MSREKHTPGPWKAMTDDFGYIYDDAYCIIDDGSKAIAYVMLSDRPRNRDIAGWEANARLIAAAPDMLEALRETQRMFGFMRSVIQSGGPWTETCERSYGEACDKIDAALSSAQAPKETE